MNRQVVTVIKRGKVRSGRPVRLPTSRSGSGRGGPESQGHKPAAPVAQQARVIESNSDYAVLEVVCSCGNRMHIQCNYGSLGSG